MTKTFYLGLGGQHCGCEWMRAFLADRPGSDFGPLIAYQIWQADLGGPFARFRVREPSSGEKLKAEARRKLGLALPENYLRWRMQRNRDEYFAHFIRLLRNKGITRTGDVSPSYAALPAPMLAGLRDGFEDRGYAVRAFFAMRDPVTRLRLQLRTDQAAGRLGSSGDEARDLAAFYQGSEAAARSRYDMTLAAVEAIFAPESRHLCLYEDLLTPGGVSAFSGFAGIAGDHVHTARPMDTLMSGAEDLPEALVAEIARHYRPVYMAVAERFPRIATLWPSARYAL